MIFEDKKFLKKNGLASPYLATTSPMMLTELKQMVGDAGFRGLTPARQASMAALVLSRKTAGTFAAACLVNHAMSGHWPWQNQGNHKMDIQIGRDKDGAPIYYAGSTFAPDTMRAMRTTGLKDVAGDIAAHKASWPQAALDVGRGIGNAALGIESGPLNQTITRAGFGVDPYMTPNNQPLRVAPHASTPGGTLRNHMFAALQGLNPISGEALGAPDYSGRMATLPGRVAQKAFNTLVGPAIKK